MKFLDFDNVEFDLKAGNFIYKVVGKKNNLECIYNLGNKNICGRNCVICKPGYEIQYYIKEIKIKDIKIQQSSSCRAYLYVNNIYFGASQVINDAARFEMQRCSSYCLTKNQAEKLLESRKRREVNRQNKINGIK